MQEKLTLNFFMNIPQKTKRFVILSLFILLLPAISHAALENPLGSVDSIPGLIGRLIKVLLGISGSVALLMFVWGGFQYLVSAGDPKKVEKGKETLKNAVLGIFIILFSYAAIGALITALSKGTVT